MSMCTFRCAARPNKFPHSAHLCTFSPVWVSMCLINFPASPNDFLHSEQIWIFTPLWVSMCAFRWWARQNDLWHWRQVKFFSLLWVTMCFFRSPICPNDFSHSEHLCSLPLLGLHILVILVVWFDMGVNNQQGGVCRTEWNFFLTAHKLWFGSKTIYCHFYFSMLMLNFLFLIKMALMMKRQEYQEPIPFSLWLLLQGPLVCNWLFLLSCSIHKKMGERIKREHEKTGTSLKGNTRKWEHEQIRR